MGGNGRREKWVDSHISSGCSSGQEVKENTASTLPLGEWGGMRKGIIKVDGKLHRNAEGTFRL